MPSDSTFCPQCGEEIPGASKFCLKCGTSLETSTGQADIPTTQLPPTPSPVPIVVRDNVGTRKAVAAKKSTWPSVVGWILIVIGVWGGLQKLTTGEGNLNTTLVTIALFVVAGIGLIRRSGKLVGIGVALVLLVGIVASLIVGPPRVQTVAETLAGSCGIDESGKAKTLKPFNTDGVVTYVSRNDSAYTSVYLLEDATGVMVVIPSKKLPTPSVNDRIEVFGLPNCPPPGATSGSIFSESLRNPGKMAPDTASKLVSSRAAMMKGGGALQH